MTDFTTVSLVNYGIKLLIAVLGLYVIIKYFKKK